MLRKNLIDRFYTHGAPADPAYRLVISAITEHTTNLDININSEATRAELRLTATMTLRDRNENILLKRELITVTSYNILSSQFTTLVSQEKVRENAINDLAQQVENQLALYFAREHQP
jgi:LPS-assembly lipoprotein